MSENGSNTNTKPPMTLGTKLIYLVIVLLWVAAIAAVYVTFFRGETTAVESPQEKAAIAETDSHIEDEEQKTLVLDADGKPVDPEEAGKPIDLPDFEFINQSGETVTKADLLGRPWVGTFVFTTCPGPCSMITGKMKMLQEDMKRDNINLVSLTVDPKTDTPERLTKYADAFSANLENWHFLTGERDDIYSLILKGFKMPVAEAAPGNIIHVNKFVVVDADGKFVDDFDALNEVEYGKLKKRLRELSEETDRAEKESDSSSEEGSSTE